MTVARVAPALALCALLAVAAWLLLREGHRGRTRPGHRRTQAHSRHVGTAQHDHDAIKEHDMTTARDAALKAAEWAVKADACAEAADAYRKKAAHFSTMPSNRHIAADHRATADRADTRQQRAVAAATMWAAVAAALHATEEPQR